MVRVLTFQSSEVLAILKTQGVYKADMALCREKHSYCEDIKQLNGDIPIWVFNLTDLGNLRDGIKLEIMRCEMSIPPEMLSEKIAMEFHLPEDDLRKGLTHNAYEYSEIVGELRLEHLKAVYRISRDFHWYFSTIKVLELYSDDVLFKEDFQCYNKKPVKYDPAVDPTNVFE